MNESLARRALNDFIVSHLAKAARSLSLTEVFADVYPGQRPSESSLLALRKRLTYLAAEGRLLSEGYGESRRFSALTDAQREELAQQEAAHAAPVALPRRVNVMSGDYVPARSPVLRPGALDFRACPSVGYRC